MSPESGTSSTPARLTSTARTAALPSIVVCAFGLALVVVSRLGVPLAPPLYDGVVVQEPYRYASPGPGRAGNPASYTTNEPVSAGTSPPIAGATGENPPQAQVIASGGAFVVGSATTSLTVTVNPMAPDPAASTVRGNVYRFRVTDQSGADLPPSSGASITVVLRVPPNVVDPRISTLVGGTWQELPTQSGGLSGIVSANVTHLGDFAITGTIAAGPSGVETPLLALAAVVGIGSIVVLAVIVRRSRTTSAPPPAPDRASSPASASDRRPGARGKPNGRRPRRGSRR
jgi:hypothetical protein